MLMQRLPPSGHVDALHFYAHVPSTQVFKKKLCVVMRSFFYVVYSLQETFYTYIFYIATKAFETKSFVALLLTH